MKFTISECSCASILIKQNSDFFPNEIEEEKLVINQVEINTCVFNDIGILSMSSSSNEKIEISFQTTENLLVGCFMLSGKIQSENTDRPNRFYTLPKGKHNLYWLPASKIHSTADIPFEGVMVCFTEQFIQKLLKGDQGILSTIYQRATSEMTAPESALIITPDMYKIFNAITVCDYTNYMKRIFAEAKVLELLFIQLEQLNKQSKLAVKTLKKHDIDKIYSAKKFVEENLQNPCSLIELAHRVGINDFKLKKGFKEILGNTVFGYLFDLRMEKAHNMLTERKSVSEVAHEVGYKNPHHFTSAFKKKFGILPSDLNK